MIPGAVNCVPAGPEDGVGMRVVSARNQNKFVEEGNSMAVAKTSVKSAAAPKAAVAKPKGVRGAEQRYHQARRASILLKHVSDPTRLQVILILADGERHVGALCAN